MGWAGRLSYLAAKHERKQVELYGLDLVWLLAKRYYSGLQQPTDIYYKRKTEDKRTAEQIVDDVINSCGGE